MDKIADLREEVAHYADLWTLRKKCCKIPMNTCATISVMLLCSFVYAEALFHFEGRLENVF